jgi:hypothetical protein
VILSIGEDKESQTPLPDNRAGTLTTRCLSGT